MSERCSSTEESNAGQEPPGTVSNQNAEEAPGGHEGGPDAKRRDDRGGDRHHDAGRPGSGSDDDEDEDAGAGGGAGEGSQSTGNPRSSG